MTENHLKNKQAVLFLLYFRSWGNINSYCFRPSKFWGKKTLHFIWSVCHPSLLQFPMSSPLMSWEWKKWCGAQELALDEQQWRLKSILPFHTISDHFCHGKGKEEEAEGWAEQWEKSLKKYAVGCEVATAWTHLTAHLTAHLTTAIADETHLLQPVWLSRALAQAKAKSGAGSRVLSQDCACSWPWENS